MGEYFAEYDLQSPFDYQGDMVKTVRIRPFTMEGYKDFVSSDSVADACVDYFCNHSNLDISRDDYLKRVVTRDDATIATIIIAAFDDCIGGGDLWDGDKMALTLSDDIKMSDKVINTIAFHDVTVGEDLDNEPDKNDWEGIGAFLRKYGKIEGFPITDGFIKSLSIIDIDNIRSTVIPFFTRALSTWKRL